MVPWWNKDKIHLFAHLVGSFVQLTVMAVRRLTALSTKAVD